MGVVPNVTSPALELFDHDSFRSANILKVVILKLGIDYQNSKNSREYLF